MTPTATDPRAWWADTVDAPDSWYYPLSERSLAALDRAVRDWRPDARPVTDLWADDDLRSACAADVGPALAALETGRGFAVLTAPPDRYQPRQLQAVYWL